MNLIELPEPSPEERARVQAVLDALPSSDPHFPGHAIGDVWFSSTWDDDDVLYIVVDRADPCTRISYELLAEGAEQREKTVGGLTLDGDLVSFGTPGLGLGRLTYRIVDRSDRYRTATMVREDT